MDPDSKLSPAASYKTTAGLTTEIIIADPRWNMTVPRARRVVERAARYAGGAGAIVLASDRQVRRLNAQFRGIDKPTNVLTFSTGDIALAHGVTRREAIAAKKHPADHLAHLVVHGALHLRGYDHEHPGDARRMEMEETRIMRRMGRPNPWRAR